MALPIVYKFQFIASVRQIYRLILLIYKLQFYFLFSASTLESIRRSVQFKGRCRPLRRNRDLAVRICIIRIPLIIQAQIPGHHRFARPLIRTQQFLTLLPDHTGILIHIFNLEVFNEFLVILRIGKRPQLIIRNFIFS